MKSSKRPITRRNFLQISLTAVFTGLLSACKSAVGTDTQAVTRAATSQPTPAGTPRPAHTQTSPPSATPS